MLAIANVGILQPVHSTLLPTRSGTPSTRAYVLFNFFPMHHCTDHPPLQRQWKDIRHQYIQKAEEEDEE